MKVDKTSAGWMVVIGLMGMAAFTMTAYSIADAVGTPATDLQNDILQGLSVLAALACAGVFFWGALVFSRR